MPWGQNNSNWSMGQQARPMQMPAPMQGMQNNGPASDPRMAMAQALRNRAPQDNTRAAQLWGSQQPQQPHQPMPIQSMGSANPWAGSGGLTSMPGRGMPQPGMMGAMQGMQGMQQPIQAAAGMPMNPSQTMQQTPVTASPPQSNMGWGSPVPTQGRSTAY